MAGDRYEGREFAVPVALFYGALFVVYGMYVPFMPVWLDWRGLISRRDQHRRRGAALSARCW